MIIIFYWPRARGSLSAIEAVVSESYEAVLRTDNHVGLPAYLPCHLTVNLNSYSSLPNCLDQRLSKAKLLHIEFVQIIVEHNGESAGTSLFFVSGMGFAVCSAHGIGKLQLL